MVKKIGVEVAEIREKWLQPHRVAQFLDCTTRHVRDLVKEGKLVGVRVGPKSMRISELSVQQFLDKNKIEPWEE